MNTAYRPANGTAGIDFQDQWCDRCKRDARFQVTGDAEDGCPILAASFRYEVDDPRYPGEWIVDSQGRTTCTAFEDEDWPDNDGQRRAQLEIAGQLRLL